MGILGNFNMFIKVIFEDGISGFTESYNISCKMGGVGEAGDVDLWWAKGIQEAIQHSNKVVLKQDNKVVISRVFGCVVGVVAEGIGFVLVTWFMLKLIMVLLELDLPGGCVGSNFL